MPAWTAPVKEDGVWAMKSPSGRVIAIMPQNCLYFEQTYYPFAEQDDIDNIERYFDEGMWTGVKAPPGPLTAGPEGPRILAEGAQRLRQRTDRAIIGLFGGNLLEMGQFFYRNDNFLMLLAGDPDRASAFLDRVVELHLRNLEVFLKAVGPHIDIILFGDDLGMQNGPQISPRMYREVFQPREKLMWDRARELAPGIKIQLNCCGGVRELLPGLIEAGLDAINPVQITCKGMEPAALKRDFGRQLTFWGGGCDTREMLSKGSPTQVRDHVRGLVEIWRPGGGFVFQQVHNILADVPPANIVAMLDAVNE
jgi:uroporphyrinogen decarboxylase